MVGDLKSKLKSRDESTFREQIPDLLHQLAILYYNTQQERQRLATSPLMPEQGHSILEDIEQLTIEIRAYATQLQARDWVKDQSEVLEQLQALRVLNSPQVAQFYFQMREDYKQLRFYLQMLDYLRLVMLEFLKL